MQFIVYGLSCLGFGIQVHGIWQNHQRRRDLDRKHTAVDELRGKLRAQMAMMEQMHISVRAIVDGPVSRRTKEALS